MEKRVFRITPTNRRHVAEQVANLPEGWFVYGKEAGRSLEQNAAQWPILEAFSKQRQWPVNGAMSWLTKEEWKDILTATFEQELQPRLAAGVNGGVVMLGRRTREYGKAKFSEWLDFLHATAAVLEVKL
jgi:hypothetical protein